MRQADRIIVNALSNYAVTAVGMVASLVMIPVVVRELGRAGFGLASLALAVWGFFELTPNILGRGLHRYIPQDLASGDDTRISRTFNTALIIFVLLGVISAVVVWALRPWLLRDTEVTADQLADGKLAFGVLIAGLLVILPLFAYRKGMESIQRYDLISVYTGVTSVARALAVIVLFKLGHGSITIFLASQLAATLLVMLLCRRALLRLTPCLTESIRVANRQSARLLLVFAAGVSLVVVGNLCAGYGFRVFVGKRLGMDELGGLAAVLALTTIMMRLVQNLANVLAPAVSAMDARRSTGNVVKLLQTGTKYSIVVASTLCVVPISVAAPFFRLWLGEEFTGLDALVYVLLLGNVFNCLGTSAQQVLLGLGKLSRTGPLVFSRGAGGLLLALVCVDVAGAHLVGAAACMYGALAAGAFALFFYSCVVTSVSPLRVLTEAFLRPMLLALAGAVVTWAVSMGIGSNQWWRLIVSVSAGDLTFAALVLVAGLSVEERARLLSFVAAARIRCGEVLRLRANR
jgi:O-antigen/teichoic acid export membrane protein